MHFWNGSDSVSIAGDSWGSPEGPLVLLMHGGGQTRHAWKGTGKLLGNAGYFAVAFDARGHGDSGWSPDGIYAADLNVEDLKCVVAALGHRRPVLVGASLGGRTSLGAVGEGHVDAAALILVDVAPRLEKEGVRNIDAFMKQKPEGFASLDEVAEAIGNYQPNRERPRKLDGLARNVRLGPDGRYRWHWDPAFLSSKFDPDYDPERREKQLEASAAALTLPTLLVRGGLSDVLSEAGAQAFLKLCPHSEYVNITNAAHMVAGDRNDAFSSAVIEFLSRTVASGHALAGRPSLISVTR